LDGRRIFPESRSYSREEVGTGLSVRSSKYDVLIIDLDEQLYKRRKRTLDTPLFRNSEIKAQSTMAIWTRWIPI
jgi:uncharacterized protein with PIN domain